MADNLTQNIDVLEKDELYTKLTESARLAASRKHKLADDSSDEPTEQVAAEKSELAGTKNPVSEQTRKQPKSANWASNFQQISLIRQFWYYFLSFFTRTPAKILFQKQQLHEVRHAISLQNNELITFDRENRVFFVSSYLPKSFNPIFKLSLEILPIINQVDRNSNFMKDVITKLVFSDYKKDVGKDIRIDAESFITKNDLLNYILKGDTVSKSKIDELMEDVHQESERLPVSLHKYAAHVLKPLYQFQKICYFPFSTFFHSFRTEFTKGKDIYSNILPKNAYDSVSILYELMMKVGPINSDKHQFHKVIDSYLAILERKEMANKSQKTAIHFGESFSSLQGIWNTFLQETPIEPLLLFTAEDPYMAPPLISEIDIDILETLPRQIESAYEQSVQEKVEHMALDLRKNRTQHLLTKYVSSNRFSRSRFYSNDRYDLLPLDTADRNQEELFAHCESFAYTQSFLRHFCPDNILKPLSVLCQGVFQSENFIYEKIIEFLSRIDNHKVTLHIIEQNLEPGHRIDTEIKEILLRLNNCSEGARDEYATTRMNIDREIRSQIERVVKELQDFATYCLSAIEDLINTDPSCSNTFNSFIPHFQYMQDYNNPNYSPLDATGIVGLWKQYISEFCLLLTDQLELERSSILKQMSKIATNRSRR